MLTRQKPSGDQAERGHFDPLLRDEINYFTICYNGIIKFYMNKNSASMLRRSARKTALSPSQRVLL